jgi:hypothetical protein
MKIKRMVTFLSDDSLYDMEFAEYVKHGHEDLRRALQDEALSRFGGSEGLGRIRLRKGMTVDFNVVLFTGQPTARVYVETRAVTLWPLSRVIYEFCCCCCCCCDAAKGLVSGTVADASY